MIVCIVLAVVLAVIFGGWYIVNAIFSFGEEVFTRDKKDKWK